MNHYDELTKIVLELKRISKQLEEIWDKVDTVTCEVIIDPLPIQQMHCDSCEIEKEED